MNNFQNRANALFTAATTLLFVLVALNAATRPFLHAEPRLSASVNEVLALCVCCVVVALRPVFLCAGFSARCLSPFAAASRFFAC